MDEDEKKYRDFQSLDFSRNRIRLCSSIKNANAKLERIIKQKYQEIEEDDDGMTYELESLQTAEDIVRHDLSSAKLLDPKTVQSLPSRTINPPHEHSSISSIPSSSSASHDSTVTYASVSMPALISARVSPDSFETFSSNTSKSLPTSLMEPSSRKHDDRDVRDFIISTKARNAARRRSRRRRRIRRRMFEDRYKDESPDHEHWLKSSLDKGNPRQISKHEHSMKTSSVPSWAYISSNPTRRSITKNELNPNISEEETISQLISRLIQKSIGEHFEPSYSGFISFIARLAYCRHEYVAGVYFSETSSVTPYRRTYEGGLSVFFALMTLVAPAYTYFDLNSFCILFLFLPLMLTMIEIKSPHRIDESNIALFLISFRLLFTHRFSLFLW